MAEFVQDLAVFIEAEGHGTRATNLFQDVLPDTPDTCIAVRGTSGAPSEGQFGSDALKYEFPGAAIWVRGPREDIAATRTLAFAVYKSVGKIQAETVNGTFHHMVRVLQPPFLLKHDDVGRPIFVFNVAGDKEVAA